MVSSTEDRPPQAPLPDPPEARAVPTPRPPATTPVPGAPPAAVHVTTHTNPARWGRVDADGTVYLRTADGERSIGSWQAGDAQAGLEHFARRYDDLVVEVELLERRLDSGTTDPRATGKHASELRGTLAAANVLGDIEALQRRLSELCDRAERAQAELAARRAAARAQASAAREALVSEAESIAGTDGNWKAGGDRMREIIEQWHAIRGADRRGDDALWKRLRAARDGFNHRRGAHFAALDEQRAAAKERKEELIGRAEALARGEDTPATANQLKALMRDWKDAGRAPKGTDDALWARFRAAQDAFFDRRKTAQDDRDTERGDNQARKQDLIARAEALDAVIDPRGAAAELRRISDSYNAIGDVPRTVARELEERMRAAEQKVRSAGSGAQSRAEPANPLLRSMREAVERAESVLTKAQVSGDVGRIRDAESALSARREWLADAERASS